MRKIYFTLFLVSMFFLANPTSAQQHIQYKSVADSGKVFITGTSTLHNWKEDLKKFECTAMVSITNQQINFKNILFTAFVENLKSESSLMDNKTYKALKKDKYPKISFLSKGETSFKLKGENFSSTIKGILTVAGIKKMVMIQVTGNISHNLIKVRGVYTLKMSDYGIKPPTALFGTIKSGDTIEVHFHIILKITND
ncbi:MAG: hypothetical protein IEMM0006_1465 [bacterium]|nr:MAG: hypothetical protein IEMM0006_1465 [bacterium]